MDINCTHSCSHQKNGKCGLKDLSAFSTQQTANNKTDCPYYAAADVPDIIA